MREATSIPSCNWSIGLVRADFVWRDIWARLRWTEEEWGSSKKPVLTGHQKGHFISLNDRV